MSQPVDNSHLRPLPQYGFGPTVSFPELVKDNPFLFRIHTPRNSDELSFIGRKFDDRNTAQATKLPLQPCPIAPTYADVAIHMEWTTRAASPYVSTSFSFAWSIWEAVRRYDKYTKHDVHIAIIDASNIPQDAVVTAAEVLSRSSAKERHSDHWKWYRFALESQDVLVYGSIPTYAILASIPLQLLLKELPSYFRRSSDTLSVFSNLAWDYTLPKPSYRKFCQALSRAYATSSQDTKLCDSSTGSIRLAMAFLSPWFYPMLQRDAQRANEILCTFAFIIAQWPTQIPACDNAELWKLIVSVVDLVGSAPKSPSEKPRKKIQAKTTTRPLSAVPVHAEASLELVPATRLQSIRLVSDEHKTSEGEEYADASKFTQTQSQEARPPSPLLIQAEVFLELVPTSKQESIHSVPDEHKTPEGDKYADASKFTQEQQSQRDVEAPMKPVPMRITKSPERSNSEVLETSSCLAAGFLIGSLLFIYIASTQRRTLWVGLT